MKELTPDLTKEFTESKIVYNKPGEDFVFIGITVKLTKNVAPTKDPDIKNHLLEILNKKDGQLLAIEIQLSDYGSQRFWNSILFCPLLVEMGIPQALLKGAFNLVRGDMFFRD
jgi:hypothetical protein